MLEFFFSTTVGNDPILTCAYLSTGWFQPPTSLVCKLPPKKLFFAIEKHPVQFEPPGLHDLPKTLRLISSTRHLI